jgi:hypothetical protein
MVSPLSVNSLHNPDQHLVYFLLAPDISNYISTLTTYLPYCLDRLHNLPPTRCPEPLIHYDTISYNHDDFKFINGFQFIKSNR